MIKKTAACFFSIFFLMNAAHLQAQVALADTALLNNTEQWKPKVSFGTFGNTLLRKASFHGFQIASIEKGKRTTQAYNQQKGLVISSDGSGLVRTTQEEKVRPYRLTILTDNADTVYVSMQMVEWERRERTTFRLGSQAPPGSEEKRVYCAEMSLQLPGDSLLWTWQGKRWREDGIPDDEPMYLQHGNGERLEIAYAKGLRKGSNGWSNPFPDGLVFSKDGRQLAALKTYTPQSVWLKDELDAPLRWVIAAAILSVLSNNGQPPQILPGN